MRARLLAAPVVAVGFLLLAPGVAMAADGGYGPTAGTGPSDTPGGYSDVLTTKTVDASGGNVSVGVPGGSAAITVPAGAFGTPVQIEVTQPTALSDVTKGLSGAGFSGYNGVAGIGVKVLNTSDGSAYTQAFAKPVSITLSGDNLGVSGEKVLMFNSATSATVVSSTVGNKSITFSISEDPNLVVVNPTAAASTSGTVSDATSTHTGKPFMGEAAVAAGLVVVGAGAVVAARRRAATR